MNVLITGANGFIGRKLVSYLLNYTDHCIFGTGLEESSLEHENYSYIKVDLASPTLSFHPTACIDVVVHLAQSCQYRNFPEGATDMLAVNVDGTLRLLEWARTNQVKKFIFTSTGNVYRASSQSHKENDPTAPDSMYAATKLAAEHLTVQYKPFFHVRNLRLFGVYGKGQKSMIIPTITGRIQYKEKISLAKGKGIFLTPLYIDDCVDAITRLITETPIISCDTLNLCGLETLHLGRITNIIAELLNLKPVVEITSEEPQHFVGDNSRLRRLLPQLRFTPFDSGIKETLS